MFIKELQIFGFKSFQEKTSLRFAPGLNCIVGPNGCGKSNILDALRWVLGEGSFSVLRCAKNEDLIFAGTARVPPVNYAEVKLVLSTEDRPELGSEVEIRRRFFRSGESEFYLNRQPCRLRDIQELFLSQGIGTKAYSIFDLRQMREIIAGNIRKMFEEAATLAKFRDAKEECQRKLELTQMDLTRLEDIIAERERIVRALRRQAGKLRAFQRLKAEERELRLLELRREYERLGGELERVRAETAALEQTEAERFGELRRLEEELRGLHSRLLDIEGERERALAEVQSRKNRIAELEMRGAIERQEVEFFTQRAGEAQAEQKRLEAQGAELERLFTSILGQLQEKNENLDRVQRRLEELQVQRKVEEERVYQLREAERRVREQLESLLEEERNLRQALARAEAEDANAVQQEERIAEEFALIKSRLSQVTGELDRLEAEVKENRERLGACRGRRAEVAHEMAALKERRGALEARRESLRLEKSRCEQELAAQAARFARAELEVVQNLFGKDRVFEASRFLEPAPGWERACEAAFFPALDFLVCPGLERGALKSLEERAPRLRMGFFLAGAAGGDESTEAGVRAQNDERVLGPLADFVRIKPDAPGVFLRLARAFRVVKDRAALEQLAGEFPEGFFVTRDGVAWCGGERLVFVGPDAGRLALARAQEERKRRLEEVVREIETVTAEAEALEQRRVLLDKEQERVESDAAALEKDGVRVESRRANAQALRAELEREEERLQAERTRLAGRRERLQAGMNEIRARLQEVSETLGKLQAERKAAEMEAEQVESVVRRRLQEATEVLAELSEVRREIARLELQGEHIRQEINEKRRRVAELARVIEEAERRRQGHTKGAEEREAALERLRQELHEAEKALERFSTQEIRRAEETLEKNIAELRQAQEQGQKLLFEQRLRQAELEGKIRAVIEEARSSYQADITTVDASLPEDFDVRLERLRHRLEALGQVNPLAAEEYEQERQDLERLLFQRADVLQAKENLERSLLEIDRHARAQFLATYQEVRGEFQRIFKELFLEGEADLVLVNDANPLESEIAIIAKPRGKNPKRLEQLSDGEKALLAVSLLFAFYQVKPAPFCFLDEVDAPLDDVNVARFADYLKRLSGRTQVIVITHNRSTVERADVLLGVTAEEPGVSKVVSVSLADYRAKENGGGN